MGPMSPKKGLLTSDENKFGGLPAPSQCTLYTGAALEDGAPITNYSDSLYAYEATLD